MPPPDPSAAGPLPDEPRRSGFELRLDSGRVFLHAVQDGVLALGIARVDELLLELPDVTFPFDVTGGAERFKSRRCVLAALALSIDAAALGRELLGAVPEGGPISGLLVEPRRGFVELTGLARGAEEEGPFSAKLGIEPDGERLRLYLYDLRLYGKPPLPAPVLEGELLALAALASGGVREGPAVVLAPLGGVLRKLLPPRGFKLPDTAATRLSEVELTPAGLRLRYAAGAGAPSVPADTDLLATVEGARAFAAAEALLAAGELGPAREAYLALGDAAQVHPFAAARLLALLLANEHAHDEALDLARFWLERRPDFAPAIWASAQVELARGDGPAAARRYLELAERGRDRGEPGAAAVAALAAGKAAGAADPGLAVRALTLSLALRRDDLPALRLLAELAPLAGDAEATLSANRKLAAFSREPAEIARAHVRLAGMAGGSLTEAKLHYDHALRLLPDDRQALEGLAAACCASGEPLRAARALSRAADVAGRSGDGLEAGRLSAAVGRLWAEELGHDENALLRYREACARLPGEAAPQLAAARIAVRLHQGAEATEHYRGYLDALGAEVPGGAAAAAAEAHLALARFSLAAAGLGADGAASDSGEGARSGGAGEGARSGGAGEGARSGGAGESAAVALPAGVGGAASGTGEDAALAPADGVRGAAGATGEDAALAPADGSRGAPGAAGEDAALAPAVFSPRSASTAAEDAAVVHLQAALRLGPVSLPSLTALARLHRRAGREAELGSVLEAAALLEDGGSARAALLDEAARIRRRRGELTEAEALLSRALRDTPLARESWAELAEVRAALGDAEGLCTALGHVADLATEPQQRASALRRLGAAARDLLGDLDRASLALSASLRASPGELATLAELVEIERRRARPEDLAVALGDLAEACRPTEPAAAAAALRERAALLDGPLGMPEDAASDLGRARALTPKDPALLAELGELYRRLGRTAEAKGALAAAVEAQSGAAPAALLLELGAACEADADPDGAAEALLRALAQRAADDGLGERLDGLLLGLGRTEARARALRVRARAVAATGREDDAAELFARSAELHDQLLQNQEEAASDLEEALLLAPDHSRAGGWLDEQARLLRLRGDGAGSARALVRRAGKLRDDRSAARRLHAAALLFGDADRAGRARALDEAVRRDPAFPLARAARATLPARIPAAVLEDLDAALAARLDDPDGPAREDRPALHRLAAAAARAAGNLDAARRHLTLLVAHAPEDDAAGEELSGLLRASGELAPLLELLVDRAEQAGGATRLRLLREAGALAAGPCAQPGLARELLERARELAPRDPEVLQGLVELSAERPAERAVALAALAGVTAEPEAAARLRSAQAEALAEAGAPEAALIALGTAVGLLPDDSSLLDRLVELTALVAPPAEHRRALSQRAELALRLGETGAPERLAILASALEAGGEPAEADAARARALEAGAVPALRATLLAARAAAAEVRGELAAAAGFLGLQAAVVPERERGLLERRRASLLTAAGELPGARAALAAALALSPKDLELLGEDRRLAQLAGDPAGEADALDALGTAALAAGDVAAAGEAFRELARLAAGKLSAPARAEAALRRALAARPDDRDSASRLSDLLFTRGGAELPEAIALARRLAVELPDVAEAGRALLRLARLAARELGDAELAHSLVREAATRAPSLREAQVALARELTLRGARREAVLALRAALKLDRGDVPDERRELLRLYADLSAETGDLAEAEGALQAILAERAWDEAAACDLAALIGPREPARGHAVLSGLAAALPDGGRRRSLRLFLADAALSTGDGERAATHLEDARRLGSTPLEDDLAAAALARRHGHQKLTAAALQRSVPALLSEGRTAEAAGALRELSALRRAADDLRGAAEALLSCEEVLAGDDESSAAAGCARERAELLASLGDARGAERAYRRALELEPDDLASLLAAAALCRAAGDAEGEADLLDAQLALLPDDAGRARAVLRLAELFQGPLDAPARAEQALLRALALDPSLAAAEAMLEAHYERTERRSDLARMLARRADGLRPTPGAALLSRAAELHATAGEPAEASRTAAAAAALLPEEAGLMRRAAELAVAAGLPDQAVARLESWLARGPDAAAEAQLEALHLARGDHGALAGLSERRAAGLPPGRRANVLLEAAKLHGVAGAGAERLRCEDAAFDDDPGSDDAFAAVIIRASEVDQLSDVLLRRSLSVPSEGLTLHRARGEALAAAGRDAEALESFDAALAIAPDDLPSLTALADLSAQLSGDEAAAEPDRRLVALADAGVPGASSPAVRARFRLAFAAEGAGAVELLDRALRAAPDHPRAAAALLALERALTAQDDRPRLFALRLKLAGAAPDATGRRPWLLSAAEAAPDAASRLGPLGRLAEDAPDDAAIRRDRLAAFAQAGPSHAAEHCDALESAAAHEQGPTQAHLLLAAARLAGERLADPARAVRLRAAARDAAPDDPAALRAVLPDLRAAGAPLALAAAIDPLLPLADPAERGELCLERARALLAGGSREAVVAFREIVGAGPDAPGFLEAAAEARKLLEASGEPGAAARVLEQEAAATADPRRRAQLLSTAARLLDEGCQDLPGAIRLCEAAAAALPEDPLLAGAVAELHERAGEPVAAAAWLEREASLLTDPEPRAERSLQRARLLAGAGQGPAANDAFRAVLADRPGDLTAWRALTAAAAAAGTAEDELTGVRALLARRGDLEPEEAHGLVGREASLCAATGRTAEAATAFAALVEAEPAHEEGWTFLRPYLSARKRWDKLLALADGRDTALAAAGDRRRGERRDLRLEKARILVFELGDLPRAEATYRAVLELDPRNRGALAALRELAERRGDPVALAAALEGELAAEPPPAPATAAGLYLKLGRLRETKLLDPAGASVAYGAARELAAKLLVPGGLVAEAERGLARSALAAGRPAEALAALERRFQDRGDAADPKLRVLALDACLALGDRAGGREHLHAALAAAPGDEELLARLEALSREEGPEALVEALQLKAEATNDPARRADALIRLAELRAGSLGDAAGAERALAQALEADPSSDLAYERLRTVYASGRPKELLELLRLRARKALREADRARALFEQGELLRGLFKDPRRAADALERALSVDPSITAAAESLAEAYVELGRDDAAEPLYRRVLDEGGGALGEFFLAYRLGELLSRTKRTGEALGLYQRAVRANPAFLPSREAAASAALSLQRWDDALEAYQGILAQLDPTEFAEQLAKVHRQVGELHRRQLHNLEATRSYEAALALEPGDRDSARRLVKLYQALGEWRSCQRSLEKLTELTPAGPEHGLLLCELGELRLNHLADMEGALAAFERARAELPDEQRALKPLVEIYAGAQRNADLVTVAEKLEAAGEEDSLEEHWAPIGRAHRALGDMDHAYSALTRALATLPGDDLLAAEVRDLAWSLGRMREYATLEELLADNAARSDPADAAARYRALATLARERFEEPARAVALFQKALSLAPDAEEDRFALLSLLADSAETAPAAVTGWLALVRARPADAKLVRSLAATCKTVGDAERARLLLTLAAGLAPVAGAHALPSPTDPAGGRIGEEVRERIAHPEARRALPRLLRLMAPALEPLFPSDVTRVGVTAADLVSRTHAPQLAARTTAIHGCLTDRELAIYLSPAGGAEATAENTRPPSLVVGLGALTQLQPAALTFLLARGIDLASSGFGLIGKFPAHDLAILCSLACKYFFRDVEVPGLPPDKVAPYLEAIDGLLPPEQRGPLVRLAAEARGELAGFDPRALSLGLRCTASRIGLLVSGHAGAAIDVLLRLGRHAGGDPATFDRATALAQNPELADLVSFALREDWTDLRRVSGLV